MPNKKKEWQKPELTVLVRSKPEEAVLTGCKETEKRAGPGVQFCYYDEAGSKRCKELMGT